MAKTKQPKYTAFLLFKELVPEAAEMMPLLSQAQLEGRAPMDPNDVAFIEGLKQAEEGHARMQDED